MRGRLVLLAIVSLVALDAWRSTRPPSADAADGGAASRPAGEVPLIGSGLRQGLPRRDPFRFGQAPVASVTPPPAFVRATPLPATPLPRPAVHLVGLVRQEGELKAALSVFGRVAVVSAGEEVDGVSVLDIDEDRGVRIRDADGQERQLVQPR